MIRRAGAGRFVKRIIAATVLCIVSASLAVAQQ